MDLLETAYHWLSLGIATIPVWYRDKRPSLAAWKEYQTRLPTECELRLWFANQHHNLAVVTGWQNLVVIDFDNLDAFSLWLDWALGRGVQNTYMVKTARGIHIYLYIDEPVKSYKWKGIVDVQSAGKYVLAPPSIHPSGVEYAALGGGTIVRVGTLKDAIPEGFYPPILPEPITTKPDEADPWSTAMVKKSTPGITVETIRQQVRIESYFPQAVRTGDHWLVTTCPFHADHNPSFWIDTSRQICGCYSGCTPLPMDVINLHARLHNQDNTEAIHDIARTL